MYSVIIECINGQRTSSCAYLKKGKGHKLIQPPYQSLPFYGSWDETLGLDVKKTKKKLNQREKARAASRKNITFQHYSDPWSHSIKFINKPLSNYDLLEWVKYLAIKHFRGVFSRDNLPTKINKRNVVSSIYIQK